MKTNSQLPQTNPKTGFWHKDVLLSATLLAALLTAYWPALNGDFFKYWDDDRWMREVGALSHDWTGLARIWSELGVVEQYYPLTATSFWIDRRWWGDWTLPYHVENVLLHASSAFLIVLLMRRMKLRGAWLAAFIFALHPVMVESVAWITERKNVLSLPFFLGALIASGGFASWSGAPVSKSRKWWTVYTLTGLLFLAALLAKISTFIFPAVVPLLGWWRTGRLDWRRDVLPMMPFALVAVALSLVVHHVETNLLGAGSASFGLDPVRQVLLAGRIPWFYAGKLLLPVDVCVMYARWILDPGIWWQWLYPAATLGLVSAAWIWRNRLGRGPLTALLCYFGALLPVLGFFKVYGMVLAYVADRWTYLPALALILPAAAALSEWSRRLRPRWQVPLLAMLPVALASSTLKSSGRFRDEKTLWSATLDIHPECWPAFNNLGNLADAGGRYEEAIRLFMDGLRFDPDNADMQNNLANALKNSGRTEEAIQRLRYLLSQRPEMTVAHHNLGLALLSAGRAEEALDAFRKALQLQPGFIPAQRHLADLLLALGRTKEAEAQFLVTLALAPNDANALVSLGNMRFSEGDHAEALEYYERTLEAAPDDPVAANNLAWLLATTPQTGLHDFERAVRLAENAIAASDEPMPEYGQTLALALAGCERHVEAAQAAADAAVAAETVGKLELARDLKELERRIRESSRASTPK